MFESLGRVFGKSLAKRSSQPAAGRRLALETLESRLTPSASMDNPVLNLYRVFLDRVAEAPALAAWSGALETGRITVGQMAEGILRSPEHADRAVGGAYREFLGRSPDAAGLAAHASALQRGVSTERVDASWDRTSILPGRGWGIFRMCRRCTWMCWGGRRTPSAPDIDHLLNELYK